MSSIKLKHSGGNSVSLNPPTSAPTSSDVAFKLPNADGSTGQYMKTDGSGNLSFATVTDPTIGISRTHQTTALSGATNYDVTIPTGCFQVDFSGVNISTSGSGTPVFRVGNSGGIITSNSYYYTQARFGGNSSGVYENGVSVIYPGGYFLTGASDVAEIHATFRKTGESDSWVFRTTTSRRTDTSLQISMGRADCANLTTVRLLPNGTGFDSGFLSWTCWSTV